MSDDRCKHCETPVEDADEICCDGKALEIAEKEIDRLTAELKDRDRDWVLAMGHALGGGFNVPIIPEVEPFKRLFAAVKAMNPRGEI